VKVALSGEGGDEVFGGYDTFNKIPTLRKIAHIPDVLAKGLLSPMLSAASRTLNYPYKQMSNLASEITAHPKDVVGNTKRLFYFPFSTQDKQSLLSPRIANKVNVKTVVDDTITSEKDIENQVTDFYFREWLPNDLLMKVDKTSMAHGLEVRAPFLDIDLIEYYSGLSVEHKYNRKLFREVVKNKLPSETLNRSKKGFTLPLSSWMQSENFVKRITPHILDLKKRNILNESEIDKILQNPTGFRNDHRLWVLLNLEIWYKEYIDGQDYRSIKL
jgi:asparagine synthase (glutamine-hydrolysing)